MKSPVSRPLASGLISAIGKDTGGARFSPRALFGDTVLGAWYDPSDLSTMWQDADGTQPVTAVGQSVSIILDKRKGLVRGSQLIPSPLTATLDAGVSAITGGFRFTAAAQNAKADITPAVAVDNQMFYEVYFTVSNYTGGNARIRIFGTGETATVYPLGVTANGTYRAIVDPHGGAAVNQKIYVEAIGAANNGFDVTNISIRELPGLHAWQTSSAAAPTLQQDAGGRYYLAFDGSNDGLQSQALTGLTFPFDVLCAAKAGADVLGGVFGAWGGAPPYYEIQKSATANQWRAFVRGAVNANSNETVGTNATPHVLMATFTATDVDLRSDATNPSAAVAQSNAIGTLTDIRIGNGGGGFFNGQFYGGILRAGTMSTTQRTLAERWLGRKAGLSL